MENNKLIALLEKEMHEDIASLNIPQDDENNINIKDIKAWYFEAEKLIRVLGNVLSVPMHHRIT